VAITDTGVRPGFVWNVEDLAQNEGGVITIRGEVSPSLSDTFILTNQADIMAEVDGDMHYNTAVVSMCVGCPKVYLPVIMRSYP
jgi:hypothetical protein